MKSDNRLAGFLLGLETEPHLLSEYKEDPLAAMAAADLSDEEQCLVLSGSNADIAAYLGEGDYWIIRPIPRPRPDPKS